MTPQLVQIAIGLIGALLGIAVTWGSQRRYSRGVGMWRGTP